MTPFDQLRATKEKLPPDLREQILALHTDAVPALIEILNDEQLGTSESPAEGWPPIHAVDLLADLKAPEAIEPMLDVLVTSSWEEILHDRIVVRLSDLGCAVMEAALTALDDAEDPEAQHSLCCVLAKLGVRDDRIYKALCDLFDGDETLGAICFADYADERALPILASAIQCFEPDYDSPVGIIGLADLVDAYETLGGALRDGLREHVDALRQDWAARAESRKPHSAQVGGQKVGRNDPCPCRSGRKYKRCCLGKASTSPRIGASPGLSGEQVALAEDYVRQKDAGRGPAQQFVSFAQPLLDSTDRSKAETQKALTLAQFLWNVAVTRDPEKRAALLGDLLRDIPEGEREAFEGIARDMLQRHREMFPELHLGAG